jgi:hypothetical protein
MLYIQVYSNQDNSFSIEIMLKSGQPRDLFNRRVELVRFCTRSDRPWSPQSYV